MQLAELALDLRPSSTGSCPERDSGPSITPAASTGKLEFAFVARPLNVGASRSLLNSIARNSATAFIVRSVSPTSASKGTIATSPGRSPWSRSAVSTASRQVAIATLRSA